MTLSLPLIISLIVVAVLTAGGMAVRSVSRIWLRHWAERQLRGAAEGRQVDGAKIALAHSQGGTGLEAGATAVTIISRT